MTYLSARPVGAKLALSLVLLASAGALASACSDDDGARQIVPVPTDAGGSTLFDAALPFDSGGVVLPDAGLGMDAAIAPDAAPGDGAVAGDASDDAGQADGGDPADGGDSDGGDTDAGDTDGGSIDAGEPSDAGMDGGADASADDAGLDAAADDASTADAGSDASVDAGDDDGYPYVRGADPTAQSASEAGPYTVATYTSGFRTTATFSAGTVYYPTTATAPFALAVLVGDNTVVRADVAGWGTFLASHGIVTMTIDVPNNVFALGAARSSALVDALASLRAENTRSGSALNGKVDTQRAALLGVGAGAHGALLAASTNASLSAVLALSLSNSQTFPQLGVPTLFITGETGLASSGVSQDVYAALPSATPKLLLELNNQGFDVSTNPANVAGIVGRYGLSWLKTFLEGDTRYRPFLLTNPSQASDYTTSLR